ncbi:DUF4189 domain-containing protein [Stenotrophomonas sp. S48]|nr:DUF4189 domain-containing protein [Stenotrophomonas sp. S48]MBK0047399.1 DUF4189 domain-containing protein [Stenotrophomonas sp. S49]
MIFRFLRTGLLPLLYLTVFIAHAEGGCPPGMYLIGGQGVQGCAPIPGAQGNGAGSSVSALAPPRPTGEWITTWGALAGALEGKQGGASVSELTEREARRKAVEDCEKRAGGRCKVEFVYHQQCVAAVVSELESTGTIYVSEATVEAATELALGDCRKAGGKQCRSIYSACTVPYFKKY